MTLFDSAPDRRHVPSEKWGKYEGRDVIPMWVADIDFAAPDVIRDALTARLEHGVFGYVAPWKSLLETLVAAMQRDHGWKIDPSWIVFLPGVVTGFNVAARIAGEAGSGVYTATPIYPPFLAAPHLSDRRLVSTPLVREGARYVWDFAGLEAAIADDVRLFMLCNPHNPVGRAFTRDELTRIGELALRHDMLICSDEIHCGLVLNRDTPHIPIASLDPELAKRTITLMAPSKTWNIPALYSAFAIIPDDALRRTYERAMRGIVPHVNVLGLTATEAAYRDGEPWRRALLDTLRSHAAHVRETIDALPLIETTHVEATYLAWIDCRALLRERELTDAAAFFEAAGLGLSDGAYFGAPGFVRLNFGCPRSTLDEGLSRLRRAVLG